MRTLIISIVIALASAYTMSAQSGDMYYKAGKLYMNGQEIMPSQLRSMVGQDIYAETCEGALKQCRISRNCAVAGISAIGGGLVSLIGGAILMDSSDYGRGETDVVPAGPLLMTVVGAMACVAGEICLDVAIPFGLVGKGRLKWVAEDYNQKNHTASMNLGFQKNGFGLALNF